MTTLCIDPEWRGQGISESLYILAEKEIRAVYPGAPITLRTWSSNQAQKHILEKMGYHTVKRLKDDRGEGIDTVYYVKE